jgi:quercetin dioxygenase-like cupin family protein
MSGFQAALRRVITGDDETGRSTIIIDGGPSSMSGGVDLGGLFEIWEDAASGPLDPQRRDDLGPKTPVLGPRPGNVQVRWFMIMPTPEGVSKADSDTAARERFAAFGGAHHIIDQSRHSAMHETHSLDVICLLQGEASLILEDGETRLTPGQVVIQRGTNHAWAAHGGPALFLAVLIDRPLQR